MPGFKNPSLVTDADRALRLTRQVEALEAQLAEAEGWRERAGRADAAEQEARKALTRVADLERRLSDQAARTVEAQRAAAEADRRAKALTGQVDDLKQRPTKADCERIERRAQAAERQAKEAEALRHKLADAEALAKQVPALQRQIAGLEAEAETLKARPTEADYSKALERAQEAGRLRQEVAGIAPLQQALARAEKQVADLQAEADRLKARPTIAQHEAVVQRAVEAADWHKRAVAAEKEARLLPGVLAEVTELRKRPTQAQLDRAERMAAEAGEWRHKAARAERLERELVQAHKQILRLQARAKEARMQRSSRRRPATREAVTQ